MKAQKAANHCFLLFIQCFQNDFPSGPEFCRFNHNFNFCFNPLSLRPLKAKVPSSHRNLELYSCIVGLRGPFPKNDYTVCVSSKTASIRSEYIWYCKRMVCLQYCKH